MLIDICPKTPGHIPLIRIDGSDTWNMDSTLASIVAPMLRQLKAKQHGIPNGFAPNDHYSDQYLFPFIEDSHNAEHVIAERKWNECLDLMIWSFEQYCRPNWPVYASPEDWEGTHESYHDRIKEGLMLFAEHYGSLWD